MKKNKLLSFLRSMRFGMILLTVIAALSIVGTLVPQGQSAEYYEQVYGGMSSVMLFLGVDHMYSTWYYIALYALLCLNLMLCSLLRVGKLRGAKAALLSRVRYAAPRDRFAAEDVRAALPKMGFRQTAPDLYVRRTLGLYGSFVTHLGMLLLVIAAACTFGLEQKADHYIMVGDSLSLADGSTVTVDGFSMENEAGQLDYISELTLAGADGTVQQATVTVNNPARFGSYTVYQQSYAFAAVLDIQTGEGAPAEQIVLDSSAFLSLDGQNGIQYMSVYGDYVEYENGQIMPTSSAGMNRPCYLAGVFEGETQEMHVLLPDEPIEVGGVIYTFREPAAYPGLRVKTQPGWVLPLLYTSFAVLVAGLYLCFFHVPSAVCLAEGKVRIAGAKDTMDVIEQLEEKLDMLRGDE